MSLISSLEQIELGWDQARDFSYLLIKNNKDGLSPQEWDRLKRLRREIGVDCFPQGNLFPEIIGRSIYLGTHPHELFFGGYYLIKESFSRINLF